MTNREKMQDMRDAAVHALMEKPGSIDSTVSTGDVSCVVRWVRCGSRDLYRFIWFIGPRCAKAWEVENVPYFPPGKYTISTQYVEGFGQ